VGRSGQVRGGGHEHPAMHRRMSRGPAEQSRPAGDRGRQAGGCGLYAGGVRAPAQLDFFFIFSLNSKHILNLIRFEFFLKN